jgi:hypothetical protein
VYGGQKAKWAKLKETAHALQCPGEKEDKIDSTQV